MKKIIIIAVMVFSGITGIFAQNNPSDSNSPEKRISRRVDRMKAEMKLTDDQAAKIKTLFLKQFDERQKTEAKLKEIRKEEKQNNLAGQQEIKNILTEEQFQMYMNKIEKKKEDRINERTRFTLIILRDELKLSDDQYNQISNLLYERKSRVAEVRKNFSNDENRMKEEMKKINKDFRFKIKTILNPEQMKKLRELRSSGKIRF